MTPRKMGDSQGNSGIRILTARQARGVFVGHMAQYGVGDAYHNERHPSRRGDYIGNALRDIGIVASGRHSSCRFSKCVSFPRGLTWSDAALLMPCHLQSVSDAWHFQLSVTVCVVCRTVTHVGVGRVFVVGASGVAGEPVNACRPASWTRCRGLRACGRVGLTTARAASVPGRSSLGGACGAEFSRGGPWCRWLGR